MKSTDYSIHVSNLVKRYGDFTAVDGISFDVKEGEIFGFLGPNGAGKTTTVHILTTIIDKTSGDAYVSGFDVSKHKDEVRSKIGIVFQDPSIDDRLTGYENLELHAMMYGIDKETRKRRINEMLEMVELSDKANVVMSSYSGGMRRRLEIARGLLNEPKVLFLDEPTVGLDTQTRRHILEYVKKLNEKYHLSVLLTTHYIEEADYLCDRVAIIDHGKIIVCDTPQKLKEGLHGDIVKISLKEEKEVKFLQKNIKKFKNVVSIKVDEADKKIAYLNVKSAASDLPEIIEQAFRSKLSITSIDIRKPSLEDVFIHYTGKSIRDEEANPNERIQAVIRSRNR
ncbi:DrugE1 family ABC transporter ATPase [Candidatus Mancarchaeum acidiphilum]|uniref:DrugE1 family ABC transporter ATPase n=1 Tax=Candidatus Mancarchaeum acidiphilum TaxID=1920749 RepID=A0A218NNB0_9ARCH|nr:ATP-binding cassette domain-containing protein [Candidatus Mancarchaeum acidiphilum]ASI13958.1 DrugE1 family ABC transporter ATPase [Candidatus Mancarchaeum acidiphilum]